MSKSDKCLFDYTEGGWKCWTCGIVLARGKHDRPSAYCNKPYREDIREKVGDQLHATFAWLGIKPKEGCGCHETQKLLNRRGAAWCSDNIEWIVGRLRQEAKDRHLPFVDAGARYLVSRAIRAALEDSDGEAPQPH